MYKIFFSKLSREFVTLCYGNTTHIANFNIFPYIGCMQTISQYELGPQAANLAEQFTM